MRLRNLIWLLPAVCAIAQAQTGSITGYVRDDRGRPIYGAVVDVHSVPDLKAQTKVFQATALSGPSGSFRLEAPAGTFELCVQLPQSELLPTCVWEKNSRRVAVARGSADAGTITLRRGYPVVIQLRDASELVAQEKAKRSGRTVLAVVDTPQGVFLPLLPKATTSKLVEFRTLAPRDVPVTVRIQSKGFGLKDEKGVTVAAQAEYKVTLSMSGEKNRQPIVLNVSDVRPLEPGK